MYSPIQMAADLPEKYESTLSVYQRRTCVMNENTVQFHDYLTIARKAKGKESWL
jgi:hypothetical protein